MGGEGGASEMAGYRPAWHGLPATWTTTRTPVHVVSAISALFGCDHDAGAGASFLAERTEAGLAANSVRPYHPTLRTMLTLKRFGMSWWSETWRP